jgi:hypothetical protein
LGVKTEADLLAEHEATQTAQEAEREERLRKAEEIATNQKIRAEKAEAVAKGLQRPKEEITPNNSLPQSDLIAILKADVAEEDIQEVSDYAKLKGITISEALKSSVVKAILSEKNEERTTANATSTGNARRGSVKPNPAQLLENANKGVMPETDEEMETLIRARKGIK